MEILQSPPSLSEYTPLSEHQSQTPASFYDGPAILYHRSSGCTLKITAPDLKVASAFAGLATGAKRSGNKQPNGHANVEAPIGEISEEPEESTIEEVEEVEISDVDVWLTSERFLLFSPSQNSGVSIPYPSISLHAVQRPSPPSSSTPPALFLQLLPQAGATFDDHDSDETISLYITPSSSPPATATASEDRAAAPASEEASGELPDEVEKIYTALSACANLHPDPPMEGDEDEDEEGMGGQHPVITFEGHTDAGAGIDGVYPLSSGDGAGGLPPPMPGSEGWITADNVGEFFDEEGNWRGRGGENGGAALGAGAGRVRARDEDEEVEAGADGAGGEETKWTRTG